MLTVAILMGRFVTSKSPTASTTSRSPSVTRFVLFIPPALSS
ncbi:unnamed protein product [Nippostrongylus brasiliensis]|uniref:Uncharacterized protein n=1 Tax=Nippostrongylus brasiliensis TaxID=27835 RepID=A0A0N4XSI1_NIPBR|nr:unnamed protein product [Nippostrongylus brasiliensis]